jgi:hypothetical protein
MGFRIELLCSFVTRIISASVLEVNLGFPARLIRLAQLSPCSQLKPALLSLVA